MSTDCRVKRCKHNINGKCDLNFRDKRECNIFMYYCDPASASQLSMNEMRYARYALGYLKNNVSETDTI